MGFSWRGFIPLWRHGRKRKDTEAGDQVKTCNRWIVDGCNCMGNSSIADFIADALSSNTDDCINWPFAVRKSSGYPAYSLCSNGKKTNVDAHRFVCLAAHGDPEEKLEAAHTCGSRLCINPKHLYWATKKQNAADAIRHGTLRGGGIYRQKIFADDIINICKSTESHLKVSAKFGVDPSYIGRLRRIYGASLNG